MPQVSKIMWIQKGWWNKPTKLQFQSREKGRELTQSYDKSPYTHRKNPKRNMTTQKRHQTFDYTAIADRLKTVSWANDSHQTGVVKPVYGIPTFLQTATAV